MISPVERREILTVGQGRFGREERAIEGSILLGPRENLAMRSAYLIRVS